MSKSQIVTLIPLLTPVVIALLKMWWERVPTVLLPTIAPLIGGVADALVAWVAGEQPETLRGAALGLASVGLREVYDQWKQVAKGKPA